VHGAAAVQTSGLPLRSGVAADGDAMPKARAPASNARCRREARAPLAEGAHPRASRPCGRERCAPGDRALALARSRCAPLPVGLRAQDDAVVDHLQLIGGERCPAAGDVDDDSAVPAAGAPSVAPELSTTMR